MKANKCPQRCPKPKCPPSCSKPSGENTLLAGTENVADAAEPAATEDVQPAEAKETVEEAPTLKKPELHIDVEKPASDVNLTVIFQSSAAERTKSIQTLMTLGTTDKPDFPSASQELLKTQTKAEDKPPEPKEVTDEAKAEATPDEEPAPEEVKAEAEAEAPPAEEPEEVKEAEAEAPPAEEPEEDKEAEAEAIPAEESVPEEVKEEAEAEAPPAEEPEEVKEAEAEAPPDEEPEEVKEAEAEASPAEEPEEVQEEAEAEAPPAEEPEEVKEAEAEAPPDKEPEEVKEEAEAEAPPDEEPEEVKEAEAEAIPAEEPAPEEVKEEVEAETILAEDSVEPEEVKKEAEAESIPAEDQVIVEVTDEATAESPDEETGAVPKTQPVTEDKTGFTSTEKDDRQRLEEANKHIARLSADIAEMKKEILKISKERDERRAARKAKQAKAPETDTAFKMSILGKDGEDGLVIGWSVPPGAKITAFEILIDGHPQNIKTDLGKENTAVIPSVNLSKECTITMHALENGRRSSSASAKYTPTP